MKGLLGILLSIFGFGAQSMPNQPASIQQGEVVSNAACYSVEPSVTIAIDDSRVPEDCQTNGTYQVSGKTYVRLRKGIAITNAKIQEGRSNWNICATTEPSGYGALRKISTTNTQAAEIGDIFWEDLNYLGDDLKDFILVLTEKTETDHVFDVYINQKNTESLPEFVLNCRETGGLVPVLEGQASNTFPPQTFSITKPAYNTEATQVFSSSCCSEAFNKESQSGFLSDYYMRISQQPKPAPAEKIGQLTKTINNEARTYDIFFHSGTIYVVDVTNNSPDKGSSWLYNGTNTKPPSSTGWRNPSLQLNKIDFITTSEWTWATPECKPAIYLYPQETTDVNVKVVPDGHITVSIPKHGDDGWHVTASSDGTLVSGNTHYPYLYYETLLDRVKVPNNGWIIPSSNLLAFFSTTLPKLGLNEKEKADFLEYWLPKLSSDSSTWFITLIDRDELDQVEPIEFSPKPDAFIRIRFYFEKLDETNISKFSWLSPNSMPVPPSVARTGFTAVDWGGILKNGSCSETFTSQ